MSKTERNILENNKGKRVWIGMSGGVDSSVSALLLKQAGFNVTGVFIKVWQPENGRCTWKDERRDAMRVAAHLDIPFLTFDFGEKYKKEVVDYMIFEYKQGRTPNPDVMCNRHIKFGSFLDAAREAGVDYVATGHYAQNILNTNGIFELKEGKDKNKDQSYFLWTLPQEDLRRVLFPIGHLEKSEVRKIAEQNGLPVFDKKDSQGICFLGHVDMKEFLKEYIDVQKGNVIDIKGNIIGEHDGALLYTIGERHGFKLVNITPDQHAKYVIAKNIEANTLTVAEYTDEVTEQMPRVATIDNISWTKGVGPNPTTNLGARLRYRQQKQPCTILPLICGYKVLFQDPQKALTPGQSLVLYDGEVCLGGGILIQ
ncbi:MAG: tRNA 2-thiouridine(34) synthase MnmA [Patescibacteria group bacterium]